MIRYPCPVPKAAHAAAHGGAGAQEGAGGGRVAWGACQESWVLIDYRCAVPKAAHAAAHAGAAAQEGAQGGGGAGLHGGHAEGLFSTIHEV